MGNEKQLLTLSEAAAIDVLTRVRNNTAARGTVYVATSRLTAVRET